MKPRRLTGPFSLTIALVSALVLSAPALANVGTVSFAGSALGGQEITGTFTLDHFDVKTPLNYPGVFVSPPQPHLVAVGTVTGQSSFFSSGVLTTVPFDDAPFVWVNLTVTASCGDSATVTFDQITGADYVGFGPISGLPLWDPSVPIPVWNPDVHWGVTATNPLVLTGNGGLACAIAQAVSHDHLSAEAKTLNALLRRQ
jgi:hypothetical protein